MIKGKIVLVSFPFDDFSATKVRPVVCLTNPIGLHRHVVLAFISSRIPTELVDGIVRFVMSATTDNRALEINTKRLCPSQALELLGDMSCNRKIESLGDDRKKKYS